MTDTTSTSGGAAAARPCFCESGTLRAAIRADVDRYAAIIERDGASPSSARVRAALSPKVWVLVGYRLAHWVVTRRSRAARTGLLIAATVLLQRLLTSLSGIEIDPESHLGPGVLFPHSGFIVIGPIRMGRNCTVSQGVTLGQGLVEDRPAKEDTPIIGDRVWIGPGAVVAGRVRIGDDVAIGANSSVLRDVPDRGVVLGVPARLVSHRGSFAQIYYRGLAVDPARLASLATARADVVGPGTPVPGTAVPGPAVPGPAVPGTAVPRATPDGSTSAASSR